MLTRPISFFFFFFFHRSNLRVGEDGEVSVVNENRSILLDIFLRAVKSLGLFFFFSSVMEQFCYSRDTSERLAVEEKSFI